MGTAGYLVQQGRQSEQWAAVNRDAVSHARDVVSGVEQERMLSLWQLSGEQSDPASLAAARNKLDAAFEALLPYEQKMKDTSGGTVGDDTGGFDTLRTKLPQIRGAIDARALSVPETYGIFNRILDAVALGTNIVTTKAPNAEVAVELINGVRVLHAMEGMSRAAALTGAELEGQLSSGPMRNEYRNLVGSYRTALPQVATDLGADPAAEKIKAVLASPAWQQVAAMEDYLINRPAPDKYGDVPSPPMSFTQWRNAQGQLADEVTAAWLGLNDHANQIAVDDGKRTASNSLWAGAGILALAIVAFLLSLWLANRLIGRLKRLRKETLDLAEVELPETMRKLREGEQVDPDGAHLDFGDDEIGSVAEAFNRAHTAAVSAAITEVRTREGVRAVFLNIAHRSQMVVHRQLELLDEAEQRQEDPALLETFFRLDHLATRERRNAENLIILGGGEPGRQWRSPVPLVELVRSAIGETLDYARVRTRRMPTVFIVGNVVADLIHLLAELVDNATAFSPPQSRVEVSGNVVGKGVAIEITDQGMGMSVEELERANEMLSNPPDFGVATLSANSRLGLFVVAQLGARHGISVRLTESEYGGIRAIVLVPTSVVAAEATVADHLPDRLAGRRAESLPTGEMPALEAAELALPAPSAATPVPPAVPTAPAPPAPEPPAQEPRVEELRVPEPPAPEPELRAWAHLERPGKDLRAEFADRSAAPVWRDPVATEPAAPQTGSGPDGDDRPPLPRRRRQASLAPELAHDPQPVEDVQQESRSAEQARDLMSAIVHGTRQARHSEPPRGDAARDEQEGAGEGDYFQRR
ncbi:sensor histidine kinase [Speluncibacter jeojiensis]|uniref:histidine kinase n=1 Tax=Speluncibacter jeojiensis TaxID=2710754 RepID=A0A9X4M6W9_9ACTN|nr:nitrate- and nitrite sensing domain-containing protein [Rhodococcus sp. D2-41]MDG3017097.1 nitrate- and nitrite sensing domain-containing protein [Corynebacteriales bacterium D3-21]